MTQLVPKYKLVARILLAVFWFLGCYAYPLQELSPDVYFAISPYASLVFDTVIILIGLWTLQTRTDKWLFVSLLFITILSYAVNAISIDFYLNGIRAYLVMMFILSITRYMISTRTRVEYFIPLFEKNLYYFLLLQFPVMIQQCIRWGAFDNVGGTLGWMMSGPISTLLYAISFYLMVRRWDSNKTYLTNLKRNWILLVCLFPSMLNETKISFIYIILYFVLLIPFGRNHLKRLLYVIPLTAIVFGIGIWTFNLIQGDDYGMYEADSMSLTDYLVGHEDMRIAVQDGTMEKVIPYLEEENIDLARGLKFATLPIALQSSPYGLLVGFGPSQFKGGTVMEQTQFSKEFNWMLMGTAISILMFQIDLGILGVFWLVAYLIVLFRAFRRVKCREKRVMVFMALVFILDLLYMAAHIIVPFMIVFVFIIMMSSRWELLKYVPEPSGWLLYPLKQPVKQQTEHDTAVAP